MMGVSINLKLPGGVHRWADQTVTEKDVTVTHFSKERDVGSFVFVCAQTKLGSGLALSHFPIVSE